MPVYVYRRDNGSTFELEQLGSLPSPQSHDATTPVRKLSVIHSRDGGGAQAEVETE
jgi:hypothetical protein